MHTIIPPFILSSHGKYHPTSSYIIFLYSIQSFYNLYLSSITNEILSLWQISSIKYIYSTFHSNISSLSLTTVSTILIWVLPVWSVITTLSHAWTAPPPSRPLTQTYRTCRLHFESSHIHLGHLEGGLSKWYSYMQIVHAVPTAGHSLLTLPFSKNLKI